MIIILYLLKKIKPMVKEKLFDVRTKKGLSQEELADLIGMTQSNYSRKENGIKKTSNT